MSIHITCQNAAKNLDTLSEVLEYPFPIQQVIPFMTPFLRLRRPSVLLMVSLDHG
jgi:hypothetical protein